MKATALLSKAYPGSSLTRILARAYGKRLTVGTAYGTELLDGTKYAHDVDGIEFIPTATSVVYKRSARRPNGAYYPVCIDLPRPRIFNTIDELLDAVDAYIIEKEIPANER